jgi:hypothetical protein
MMQETPLINRVAESGLTTLDLADLLPKQPVLAFDMKPLLVQGLVLMEKAFREHLKQTDWQLYKDQIVAVYCSADALIPKWAYMLLASYLQPVAKQVVYGSVVDAENALLLKAIADIDVKQYEGARLVIKGCGDRDIPAEAYLAISTQLLPVVKSLMYGEPCSTVPIYKQPK